MIEKLDEQMTVTSGGQLERHGEKPKCAQSSHHNHQSLMTLHYRIYQTANLQKCCQLMTILAIKVENRKSDRSNHHTPSTSCLLFVVESVVSQSATINNDAPNRRTSLINYN